MTATPPPLNLRSTAATIAGFIAVAVGLSVAPHVPDDLRPLQLSSSDERTAAVHKVFARPKMTLAEHEQKLEGHVKDGTDEDGGEVVDVGIEDSAADVAFEKDLNDESRAATDLAALAAIVQAPPAAEAEEGAPVDRPAVVKRADSDRSRRLRAQAKGLQMPGGTITNPCVKPSADAGDLCDETALDAFFSTLDAVARGDDDARAAVVVLGNSLLASDHVTDIVRTRLNESFGNAGRGFLLPERLVKGVGRRVRTGTGSDGWIVHNFARDPPFADGVVFGFSGAVYEAGQGGDWSTFATEGATVARVFFIDTGAPLRLEVEGRAWLTVPASKGTGEVKDVEVQLPPLTKTVKLVADAGARVYGVALERDREGVIVDTIGVPAASTKLYTEATSHDVMVQQLRARTPTMLVAMLGGNETRSFAFGTLDEATFGRRLSAMVDTFREAAPTASCLLVTPIDAGKTTTSDDTLITRDEIRTVIAIQKAVAAEKGCGFFDLFGAMGGAGSLQRMREKKLVSDDLVHPTARGGDVLGQLFADAILQTYVATPPQTERLAHRRQNTDEEAPRFSGLSFPKVAPAPLTVGAAPPPPRRRPLERFFSRLDELENKKRTRVAIGQFGASHTAGQSLTDRMRARLGERYGVTGRGFVSVDKASKRLLPSGVVRDIVGAFDIADGRDVVTGGAMGMAGTKARLLPGATFRVGFCQKNCDKKAADVKGSISLAWLYTPDMGTAEVLVDGERRATLSATTRRRDSDVQFLSLPVDREDAVLEVRARDEQKVNSQATDSLSAVGPIHLLGVVEETERPGIVLDAVGLPGTTGMTPQRWRQDLYSEEVRARHYDLIVTAWGTNEAGLSRLDDATYRHHFGATIHTLKAAAPDADCLIVGASDRFDEHNGAWVSAPSHELVERAQKALAAEHGCAFFSMRDAMGGPGAMKRWVKEGLALDDHVHFTRAGYSKMADLLIDDLMLAARWQREGKTAAVGGTNTGSAVGSDVVSDDDDAIEGNDDVPVAVPAGKTAAAAGGARALP
jgi:lysophospholipase L1-like esterase